MRAPLSHPYPLSRLPPSRRTGKIIWQAQSPNMNLTNISPFLDVLIITFGKTLIVHVFLSCHGLYLIIFSYIPFDLTSRC
jgi:hypothetical protein